MTSDEIRMKIEELTKENEKLVEENNKLNKQISIYRDLQTKLNEIYREFVFTSKCAEDAYNGMVDYYRTTFGKQKATELGDCKDDINALKEKIKNIKEFLDNKIIEMQKKVTENLAQISKNNHEISTLTSQYVSAIINGI